MKKHLLTITLITSLILWSTVFAQDEDKKLKDLKTRIYILNLLNGLELNKQQMRLILDAAYEAERIRNKAKEAASQKENEIAGVYNEVLKVAETGSLTIPDKIAVKVHKLNQEIDKTRATAQNEIENLAKNIKDNLRPYQLYVLEDYKPCIIPAVKEGRIGQAEDSHGFSKTLERVRSMPEDVYNLHKDEIIKKAIDNTKVKAPAGYILDEDKLKSELQEAIDETRKMSDVDFSIKKNEIAKNIKTLFLPERPPMNIGVKIERFLLQPEIIPILEKRIADKGD